MKEIQELSTSLGKKIKEHQRFKSLRRAEEGVQGSPEAQELLQRYDEISHALQHKERSSLPIEPGEKRRFQELQEKISVHPLLKELIKAQADYSEMMNLINRSIFEQLDEGHVHGPNCNH